MRSLVRNPVLLWSSFLLVHLWLGWLNLNAPGLPLGDVSIVYKFWVDQIFYGGFWVGIHSAWVYPILAIFPMLLASVFGPDLYSSTWLSLVLIVDLVAFGTLIGWGRRTKRVAAAWWWILFLVLLGPIALGRIDAITVALSVMAVCLISNRPWLSSLLLAIATWVKVWPAALILAMLTAIKNRARNISIILGFSLVVIVVSLGFGAGSNLFSFITEQTNRGLQVEAPVSSFWLWRAFLGMPGNFVYYDKQILTWQVTGDGVGIAESLMTPLMLVVVVIVLLLAVIALRRGASSPKVFAVLSLGLVVSLIAFNKVGSPQFVSWLAVPIVLGLSTFNRYDRRWFAVPAFMVAVVAALTQTFYPYLYGWLLSLNPFMLVALSLRNILYFLILAWVINELVTLRDDSELGGFVRLEQDSILNRPLS